MRLLELETLKSEAFAFGGEGPVFNNEPQDAGQALGDVGLFDLLTAFQEVLRAARHGAAGSDRADSFFRCRIRWNR
jgi:hypothetical protein